MNIPVFLTSKRLNKKVVAINISKDNQWNFKLFMPTKKVTSCPFKILCISYFSVKLFDCPFNFDACAFRFLHVALNDVLYQCAFNVN